MSETNGQRYLRLRWEADPAFRHWLCTLAHNLAIGAALCWAESPQNRAIAAAHRKIGETRSIVEEFWRPANAADPYDRKTAWAMHVALVQLAEVLKR